MYETGERIPSTYVYQSMADLFNVDLDYIMGHSDISTTLRYYVGITDEMMEDAKQIMSS